MLSDPFELFSRLDISWRALDFKDISVLAFDSHQVDFTYFPSARGNKRDIPVDHVIIILDAVIQFLDKGIMLVHGLLTTL